MKLIQKGNSKLHTMYMFNVITNLEVCGRTCKGCYAAREQVRFPAVTKVRQARYEQSLQLDFSSKVVNELKALRNPPKHFRIHASGEFYDQAYINKWASIAKAVPDITFYTYTKRLREFDFTKLKALPNVVIVDSFHYGGLNYGKLSKAPANAVICPHQKGVTDVTCGVSCTKCMDKSAEQTGIYFVKH